jgi:hypothetical protein
MGDTKLRSSRSDVSEFERHPTRTRKTLCYILTATAAIANTRLLNQATRIIVSGTAAAVKSDYHKKDPTTAALITAP